MTSLPLKRSLYLLTPIPATQRQNPSPSRKNDRLQERLARAVAAKSNTATSSPSQLSSRDSSPVPSNGARPSVDAQANRDSSLANHIEIDDTVPRASEDSGVSSRRSKDIPSSDRENHQAQDVTDKGNEDTVQEQESKDAEAPGLDESELPSVQEANAQSSTDDAPEGKEVAPEDEEKSTVARLKADHDAAEARWQEESHGYLERIDALQLKLKYLAKEAAESAKQAAATADPKSLKKQLLEKDEKIALLLEEGQQLSKSELDHRTVIKKFRNQLTESTKAQEDAKKLANKLEGGLAASEIRVKRAEAAEKRVDSVLAAQEKATKDIESVTTERNAMSDTIQDMKGQLSRAVARAESAEAKVQSDALEQEKRRAAELEEELTNSKIEHELAEERFRRQAGSLEENVDKEKGRAKALETELKNEQTALESKMESLRVRAEEASSGAIGDTQVKLLRQIETLQTQYAVASENWRALEGSMLSRLVSVERERDDLVRQEGDVRRKMREAVSNDLLILSFDLLTLV